MRVRSMVGLIPLFAVEVIEPEHLKRLPEFKARLSWFLKHRPESCQPRIPLDGTGVGGPASALAAARTSDEAVAAARHSTKRNSCRTYGIRSLSKVHAEKPYVLRHGEQEFQVGYVPAKSTSGLFGGNSNWRGPIWMPVNYLLIESIYDFYRYYGDDFKIECPVGSGRMLTLREVAEELSRRLARIFLRDTTGRRPVHGDHPVYGDAEFRDHVLFFEYFHGDTGRGVGASHQTGWSGLIALLLHPRAPDDVCTFAVAGKRLARDPEYGRGSASAC